MLAAEQTFRRNKIDQTNKIVLVNKTFLANKIALVKKLVLENKGSSSEQNSSRKRNSTSEQITASKQDIWSNSLIDVDPNIPCDKLRSNLEKPIKSESDIVLNKMLLDELLRVEALTKKQYINICKIIWFAIHFEML